MKRVIVLGVLLLLFLSTNVFASVCTDIVYTLKAIDHDDECYSNILVQIERKNECQEYCFTEFNNFFLSLDNGFKKNLALPSINPHNVLLKSGHCEDGLPSELTIGVENDEIRCFQRFDLDEELSKARMFEELKVVEDEVNEEDNSTVELGTEQVAIDLTGFALIALTLLVGVVMYFLVLREKSI